MIKYDKSIKIYEKLKGGYLRFYDPKHPLSDSRGLVYVHRHEASVKYNRWLCTDDHVHHINGVKTDNSHDNLIVIKGCGNHTIEHARLSGKVIRSKAKCAQCGKQFKSTGPRHKYCSQKCRKKNTRKFNIDKHELSVMVWKKPTREIAKELGVSDTAVAKRCKKYGISKPPRGYWAKRNKNRDMD